MSSIMDEIAVLMDELTYQDIYVYDRGSGYNKFKGLLRKMNNLENRFAGEWIRSPERKLAAEKEQQAYLKARETRNATRTARAEWCKKNLKVGDWVKVTGTTSNCKYRKVLALSGTTFSNIQGDPAMDKTRNYTAQTEYANITHIMNPETRIMETLKDVIAKQK